MYIQRTTLLRRSTGYSQAPLNGQEFGGDRDVFVVKWKDDGTRLWTLEYSGSSYEAGNGIKYLPYAPVRVNVHDVSLSSLS